MIYHLKKEENMNQNIPVAGVDVSKAFSNICILAPDNSVYKKLKIYHDFEGMNRAAEVLNTAEIDLSEKLVVVMEATSYYHRFLYQFLTDREFNVIVINPIQSGSIKNINVRKVKNDKVDAYKIALLYRLKEINPSIVPQGIISDIRGLCRHHSTLMGEIASHTNRLIFYVEQAFPGYNGLFSKLIGKTSLEILERFPTPEAVIENGIEEIISAIAISARKGGKWALQKASELIRLAEEALHTRIRHSVDSLLIRSTISVIKVLQDNVKSVDDEINRLSNIDPNIKLQIELLKTIPGIADYSAAVILSEIGDFSIFKKPKQLVAFFGLDPSQNQSGNFNGTMNKISKRGSPYLRAIINIVAVCNISKRKNGDCANPVISEYYEKKCKTKPAKIAHCAVMHKLVNIIFAVLRDQKTFELRTPEEHIKILERNCLAA
jgi:transposase